MRRDSGEWEVSNGRTLKIVEVELQCVGHADGFDDLPDNKLCINAQNEYRRTKYKVLKVRPTGTMASAVSTRVAAVSLVGIDGANLSALSEGDEFWAYQTGATGNYAVTLVHNEDDRCPDTETGTVFKFVVKTSEPDTSAGIAGAGTWGNYWVHQQASSSNVKVAADLKIRRFAWIETDPSGEYSNYVKAKLKVSETWSDNPAGMGLFIYNQDLRVNSITVGVSYGLIIRRGVPYPYEEMSLFKGEVRIKGPSDSTWAISPTSQAKLNTGHLWPWQFSKTISIATGTSVTTWVNCFKVGDPNSKAEAQSRATVSGAYVGPGSKHITIGHAEFDKVVEVEEDMSFGFEITGSSCP